MTTAPGAPAVRAAAPRCSDVSRGRAEPVVATASRVERWLLVEHSGPWGPESVPSSRMALPVARRLEELARAGAARLLLVRRHRDEEVDEPGRWVFAVDSRPGSEQVRARHVDDDDALLGLSPWQDPTGWTVVDDPLYLVCTHGRHDRCCAIRGRPVAHALSRARPGQVWESSHVGGDRFAPNLVVLPEGLYVGRVEADQVVDVVQALEDGVLPDGLVRGRSSLPLPTQAAQHFARQATGRLGRDDLALVRQETVERDVWRVVLGGGPGAGAADDGGGRGAGGGGAGDAGAADASAGDGLDASAGDSGAGDVAVVVRYVRTGEPAVLSCGDPEKTAPSWELVSLSG